MKEDSLEYKIAKGVVAGLWDFAFQMFLFLLLWVAVFAGTISILKCSGG